MPSLKELTGELPTPGTTVQPMAQPVTLDAKEAVVANSFVKNFYPGISHHTLMPYLGTMLSYSPLSC